MRIKRGSFEMEFSEGAGFFFIVITIILSGTAMAIATLIGGGC